MRNKRQRNTLLISSIYKKRKGGMPMTDVGAVNILASLSTIGNIILYALIAFLIVMWVKKKDKNSQKDKTENN